MAVTTREKRTSTSFCLHEVAMPPAFGRITIASAVKLRDEFDLRSATPKAHLFRCCIESILRRILTWRRRGYAQAQGANVSQGEDNCHLKEL
jgi:hypothetical protein